MALVRINGAYAVIDGSSVGRIATFPTLEITAISGEALSATSGIMSVTINVAAIVHWRMKAGSAPTDKLTEFPNESQLLEAGTHSFPNSNVLTPSTLYYVGAWAEDAQGVETEISSAVGFTTPAESSDVITTAVTPTTVTISEDLAVGSVVANLVGNGVPAPTFTELTDTDAKFTVALDGTVTLAAALDFDADTSHTLGFRAANSSGNYDAGTLVATVSQSTSGGGGAITPDATVSSLVALEAQLAAWNGTGTGPRYIAVQSGSYAKLTVSGKNFTAPVIIYSENEAHGAVFAGIDVTNCTDLQFYALKSLGTNVYVKGTITDVTFDNILCKYSDTPGVYYPDAASSLAGFGFLANHESVVCNATRLTLKNSLFLGWNNGIVFRPLGSGHICEGNQVTTCNTDSAKIQGANTGLIFRRNWLKSLRNNTAGDHPDILQLKGGVNTVIWGNFMSFGSALNGADDDDFTSHILYGGIQAGETLTGTQIEQNIIVGGHPHLFNLYDKGGTISGQSVLYNDVLGCPSSYTAGARWFKFVGTSDYNISTSTDSGSWGPNGVGFDYTVPANFTPYYKKNLSGANALDHTSTIGAFMPPSAAARTSIDYATPSQRVGAYLRKAEIMNGVNPGVLGIGEIASNWETEFNSDSRV
jgi:hypothetical protein